MKDARQQNRKEKEKVEKTYTSYDH